MSPDDRCPAVHPELGLRCERLKKHCNGPGIDPTAKREDWTHALWPNINHTGSQWRYLPREYQPWQTVYGYFRAWRIASVWECIFRAILNADSAR